MSVQKQASCLFLESRSKKCHFYFSSNSMTDVNEFAGTSLGASLRPASAGPFPDRHYLSKRQEGTMAMNRRKFLRSTATGVAGATLTTLIPTVVMADDEILISHIHDQSGGLDIYGKAMVETLDLAIEELNTNGGLLGRKVKAMNYDPQSNMQLYAQYAQQAALKDRAAVVLGGITSASREVIRPVLRRYQTLYFYNTLYEGGACDRNHFATGTTPAQTVEKLVPYCIERFGKKIYTIAADYNYGHITSDWVKKFAQENGAEIVATEFFPLDVSDFSTTISKIQAAKPDMVMSALVGGAHISFYRQWAAAGMKKEMPVASTTFGAGQENIALTAEEGDGILYACGYFEDLDTPASKSFMGRFKAKYGDNHSYLTELPVATYEAFWLWAKAVEMAGTLDRMKVIEALETGIAVDGPSGKVKIHSQSHHCSRSAFIAECKNQRFQLLESYENQFPADTAAVCDLQKNPNDNQHYKIKV